MSVFARKSRTKSEEEVALAQTLSNLILEEEEDPASLCEVEIVTSKDRVVIIPTLLVDVSHTSRLLYSR